MDAKLDLVKGSVAVVTGEKGKKKSMSRGTRNRLLEAKSAWEWVMNTNPFFICREKEGSFYLQPN